MDFFNKLTQKAKETYEGASKKTGELAKEAKLRMKMNENKSEINSLYQEIGKKVYEKHVLSEGIDIKIELEEECTKIDVLSAEIESCLNQIRELKDKKQCPKCFNEIALDAKFCNHCGAKQYEEEVREVEVINEETAQDNVNADTATVTENENSNIAVEEIDSNASNETDVQEANNEENKSN